MKGAFNVLTDPIKVMLCTSAYTPAQATHAKKSDVTSEVVGAGYTARGAALTSPTCASAAGKGAFSSAPTAWAASTITARFAVIYKDSGTDSTSPLIAWVDFGADKVSVSGTFTLTWDAAGIVDLT